MGAAALLGYSWLVHQLTADKSKVRTHKESTAGGREPPHSGGREPPHSGGRVAVDLPHSIKHFEVAVAVICRYIITFNLFDSGTVCAFSV